MSILDKLVNLENTASSLVTTGDRIMSTVGRGRPRWHRWRALRLRVRATRLAVRGNAAKAAELRTRAAVHLAHAIGSENLTRGVCKPSDTAELKALLLGVEPLDHTLDTTP